MITDSSHATHNVMTIAYQGDETICRTCNKVVTIDTRRPPFMIDDADTMGIPTSLSSCDVHGRKMSYFLKKKKSNHIKGTKQS